MSEIKKILAVPHVLSLHMFLPLCIHHRKCTATSNADTADSYCSVVMAGFFALQMIKYTMLHFSVSDFPVFS